MQRFALDPEGKLVFVKEAKKEISYRCPECLADMRVKKGGKRRAHFSHYSSKKRCLHKGVGTRHLKIQQFLLNLLKQKNPDSQIANPLVSMECFFPEIRRIADICWEKEKIIFEVQCSSIQLKEIKQRVLDYASIGYRTVFLFDEKTFNKKRSQVFKIDFCPYYFFDLNRYSIPVFYDLLTAKNKLKSYPLSRSTIDLTKALYHKKNSLYFYNDFTDLKTRGQKKALFFQKESLEKQWRKKTLSHLLKVHSLKKRIYFFTSLCFRYLIFKIG